MSETPETARVCPYLRGRRGPQPQLFPTDGNHCVVAASIHLPQAQQSRYCLGGRHTVCSRFIRQRTDALPEYITGIKTEPPSPPLVVPDRPTLLWRRPIFRRVVMYLVIIAVVIMTALGWRWRSTTLPSRITPRPPLPTAIAGPVPATPSLFAQPTQGAAPR